MYNVINNRSSVPDLYVKQLEVCVYGSEPQSNYHHVHLTTVCSGCANNCWRDFKCDHILCWWTQPVSPEGWWLHPSCESVQASSYFHSILLVTIPFQASHLRAHWSGMHPAPNHITAWDTGSQLPCLCISILLVTNEICCILLVHVPGCPVHLLQRVGAKSVTVPPDYVSLWLNGWLSDWLIKWLIDHLYRM